MKYYLKKCWPTVTAASICMVVAYGLQVCTSLVQIQITQGLLDGDLRAFTIRIILLLLTWLAVVLCLIAETFFQGRAVRRMNNALRRDMAAGLLHKTHQEYHKQESGEYLSQFTNDVNQIEQMAWTPFFTIMGSAAQVVFGIVALASIHWLLLVISLVIALVMIFVPRLFSQRLGTVGTACAASQADSVSKIKDLLAGYDVLRFFGKDERFTSGVDAASDSMEQAKYKLTINKDGIGCGLAYVSAVCQVAVVILLGVLILNDMIPLATFMGTGTICAGVYNGLNQVSKLAVSFSASKPYFDKITIHAGEAQLPDFGLPTLQEGITVKDVSFGYDEKKPILVHMNAEFKKGGKYALTGPSGCGKTTLLRMIAGFNSIEGGDIFFNEKRINDMDPSKRNIGMVFQNYAIFPNLSVRDNVAFGLKNRKVDKAEIKKRTDEFLNLMQIMQYADRMPNQLSGGQQQRIALARALVISPDVLLMDEPLSNLDAKLRVEMRSVIRHTQKSVGITTVYVTHDQEEAMAISDRIAVMKDGVIQHVGTPRDIYQRPKNVFVATFIGRTNIVNAHVKDGIITFADGYHEHIDALDKAAEQDVRCSIRPEEFIICKDGTDGIHGTVQECTYLGLNTHYTIDTDQGDSVEIVEESSIGEGLKKGEKVLLKVKKEKINVFTKDGGTNLIRSDAYEKQ